MKIFLIILLGIGLPCLSLESQNSKEIHLKDEDLALIHFIYGIENLLSKNFILALEDFEKASLLLERLSTDSLELDFLIDFGKIIAFDNLGLKNLCQKTMNSLVIILYKNGEDENFSMRRDETLPSLKEYEEAAEVLKTLTLLAPSTNVREFLQSLIDELSSHLYPLFKISKADFYNRSDWEYYNYENEASIYLCKSHTWEKLEKISKRIYMILIKTIQIWELLKEIGEIIKNE
jgi:hypothetical protein